MSAGDWKDLYQAALTGNLPLVQHHISEGVNPNYQHPRGAVHATGGQPDPGHMAVAHYLLDHGADPNLRSEFDGLTPLQAARKHGRSQFVQLLQRARRQRRAPAVLVALAAHLNPAPRRNPLEWPHGMVSTTD
jgi:ankyrin repeat protein